MKSLQPSLLFLALLTAVLCLVGALLAGLGTKLGWWGFGTGFSVLRYSVYLVGVAVVLVVVSAILAAKAGTSLLDYRYFVVLLIASIVFGVPYNARQEFRKLPTIADATTDFDDAPTFVELAAVREKTATNPLEFRGGEAIERQKELFPNLTTLTTQKTPAQIIASAEIIAKDLGWEIASAKPGQGSLEATATTFWFGFKDDVVVRARAQENGDTLVDVRSASRVGFLDGGANVKRVLTMIERLSE